MKKLGKLSLKEMEDEMPVINQSSMKGIVGGYDNDCWWRSVAYIKNGCANYSASDAEYYANDYYTNGMGCSDSPEDYYQASGAGMDSYEISNYRSYNQASASGEYAGMIAYFNKNNISNFENDGMSHAVVITCFNTDGSLAYFDPQTGEIGTIIASERIGVETHAVY